MQKHQFNFESTILPRTPTETKKGLLQQSLLLQQPSLLLRLVRVSEMLQLPPTFRKVSVVVRILKVISVDKSIGPRA
jgi:hypothetical protein